MFPPPFPSTNSAFFLPPQENLAVSEREKKDRNEKKIYKQQKKKQKQGKIKDFFSVYSGLSFFFKAKDLCCFHAKAKQT